MVDTTFQSWLKAYVGEQDPKTMRFGLKELELAFYANRNDNGWHLPSVNEGMRLARICNGLRTLGDDIAGAANWSPTDDAYMRACRAHHWHVAQMRAHGIEPDPIPFDAPHDPPEGHVFSTQIMEYKTLTRSPAVGDLCLHENTSEHTTGDDIPVTLCLDCGTNIAVDGLPLSADQDFTAKADAMHADMNTARSEHAFRAGWDACINRDKPYASLCKAQDRAWDAYNTKEHADEHDAD